MEARSEATSMLKNAKPRLASLQCITLTLRQLTSIVTLASTRLHHGTATENSGTYAAHCFPTYTFKTNTSTSAMAKSRPRPTLGRTTANTSRECASRSEKATTSCHGWHRKRRSRWTRTSSAKRDNGQRQSRLEGGCGLSDIVRGNTYVGVMADRMS